MMDGPKDSGSTATPNETATRTASEVPSAPQRTRCLLQAMNLQSNCPSIRIPRLPKSMIQEMLTSSKKPYLLKVFALESVNRLMKFVFHQPLRRMEKVYPKEQPYFLVRSPA